MEFSWQAVLSMVFTWEVLLAIIGGTLLGLIVGALPGLGSPTGMAIMLPLAFRLEPVTAVALLSSMWASAIYGGSWTAILVNVPGESMSVATAMDGFPMAKQGRAMEALGAATAASFVGGLLGVLVLIIGAPFLIDYVLEFGPPEYVWVNLFALVIIALAQQKGQMLKGLVAASLGLSISLVGIDQVIGIPRYTFGSLYLQSGISFVVAMVGLFGFAEVIAMVRDKGAVSEANSLRGNLWTGVGAVFHHWRTVLLGAGMGGVIGILPGIGGSAANLLAYSEAQRRSKHPETFGKGNVEGVIASESANNAIQGTALIPSLTLGIPGSSSAAILLLALIMQGFQPGRSLFSQNGDLVGAFFLVLILAQFAMLLGGLATLRALSLITLIPREMLVVGVAAICFVGVYSVNNSLWDVLVAVLFGYLGFFMRNQGYPVVGLVVGLILGAMTEQAFIQSLQISDGNYSIFFTRPVSLVLIGLILLFTVLRNVQEWKQRQTTVAS